MQLEVTSIDEGGRGIARTPEGKVVFIPDTLVGEVVLCKITLEKKKYAEAKVYKILTASPDRVTPPCAKYFACGGCSLMHIKACLHKDIKINSIKNAFSKIAKQDILVDDFVNGAEYNYRNKAQFVFGVDGLGFYAKGTHKIIPVTNCMLNFLEAKTVAETVESWQKENKITAYNEATGEGILRHLILRKLGGEISVLLVVNHSNLPSSDDLILRLKALDFTTYLHVSKNTSRGNKILGESPKTLHGEPAILADILGIKAPVTPFSFMQVNDEIRDKMYSHVEEIIKKIQPKTVVDAYAGIGIMGNLASKYCSAVTCIEINSTAVADGQKTAKLNGNDKKITFIEGDSAAHLPPAELVILDPPRAGCAPQLLNKILATKPNHIIYISCNPQTLARDIAHLSPTYKTKTTTAYNMFPQTSHVETLVVLERV